MYVGICACICIHGYIEHRVGPGEGKFFKMTVRTLSQDETTVTAGTTYNAYMCQALL